MTTEIYFQEGEFVIEFPTSLPGEPGADGGYTSPALTAIAPGSTFAIPAGKRLMGFGIDAAAGSRTFTVGTTVGGDELDSVTIPTNTDYDVNVRLYTSTGVTIHFTGFTGNVRIYLL